MFVTAGADRDAIDALRNPEKYSADETLQKYSSQMKDSNGSNTSLAQVKEVAQAVMRTAMKRNAGIGGSIQIAMFEQGELKTEIPNSVRATEDIIWFNLFNRCTIEGYVEKLIFSKTALLFVNSTFARGVVPLNMHHYYFGSRFSDCIIFMNSNMFSFPGNDNKVENCTLLIAKDVDLNSPRVKAMMVAYPWLRILRETDRRN